LDPSKPRLIQEFGDPITILEEVALGIDLFSILYPSKMTELSFAITFELEPTLPNDTHYIDLQQQSYRNDPSPILEGCECYTCSNHKRSYLHHLKNTHEITFLILLQIHNHHHYLKFIERIRTHISSGTFLEYKERFIQNYN